MLSDESDEETGEESGDVDVDAQSAVVTPQMKTGTPKKMEFC